MAPEEDIKGDRGLGDTQRENEEVKQREKKKERAGR